MQVYVLLDRSNVVYGVLTDLESAEAFITADPDFMYVEAEVDDFTTFNEVMDELGDEEQPVERDDED